MGTAEGARAVGQWVVEALRQQLAPAVALPGYSSATQLTRARPAVVVSRVKLLATLYTKLLRLVLPLVPALGCLVGLVSLLGEIHKVHFGRV